MHGVLPAVAICAAILLAGCSSGRDGPGSGPTPTDSRFVDPRSISFVEEGVFDHWIPLAVAADTNVTMTFAREGSRGIGIVTKYVDINAGPPWPFSWFAYDNQEYSGYKLSSVQQQRWEESCLDGTDPPCERFHREWPNYSRIIDDIVFPRGEGWLIVQGQANVPGIDGKINVTFEFDRDVRIGEPVDPAPSDLQFVAPELFNGSEIEIERCGDVVWCGHVENGFQPLEFGGYEIVDPVLRVSALDVDVAVDLCLVNRTNPAITPECAGDPGEPRPHVGEFGTFWLGRTYMEPPPHSTGLS